MLTEVRAVIGCTRCALTRSPRGAPGRIPGRELLPGEGCFDRGSESVTDLPGSGQQTMPRDFPANHTGLGTGGVRMGPSVSGDKAPIGQSAIGMLNRAANSLTCDHRIPSSPRAFRPAFGPHTNRSIQTLRPRAPRGPARPEAQTGPPRMSVGNATLSH
jgi:hypothetical protein